MKEDYRWILEQACERIGFMGVAEQHLRDILLEAENEAPQDSIYEKELERCTEILGTRWDAASGCNGLLCVAEHLDNILKTLKEQRGEVLLPLTLDCFKISDINTDVLREKIMPLLRVQIEEYQKKLEEQAINIILHEEGPVSTFIEIENDEGAGVGIGEYLPQKGKYSKLRITAADILNMKDAI